MVHNERQRKEELRERERERNCRSGKLGGGMEWNEEG
jgi:hypothetical protein